MTVDKFKVQEQFNKYEQDWTESDQKEWEENKITWSYNENKQMDIWKGFLDNDNMNELYPDYYIKDEKDIKEFVKLCNEWDFEDITIDQYSYASDKEITTFLQKFTFNEVFK